MLFAAGAVGAAAAAASSAIDLLSALTPAKSGAATGVKPANSIFPLDAPGASAPGPGPAAGTSPAPGGALSPSTFNALLSAQDSNGKTNASDALMDLFARIDGNSDGKITKAEFEDKLGAGGTNITAADNVFKKLDTDGDGTVSLEEMASALKGKHDHSRAYQASQYDLVDKAMQRQTDALAMAARQSVSVKI